MKEPQIDESKMINEWVKKYDKRVNKISENPRPDMFRANKLLYEMLLDYFKKEKSEIEKGHQVPVAYSTATPRLLMALGFRTYVLDCFSDFLTPDVVQDYFNFVRSKGFPESTCDRVQLLLAVAISGHIPRPDLVTTDVTDCCYGDQAYRFVGWHWNVPTIEIDVPFEQDAQALDFVEEQLWDLIRFCEKEFPGVKYNEERLKKIQNITTEAQYQQERILQLSKHKPCPISGRDALRMPPRILMAHPKYPDYFAQVADEMQERIEQGITPLKDNKENSRVFWMTSAPFYDDPFSFLEQKGCASPLYEEGPGVPSRHVPGIGGIFDPDLSPVRHEAATQLTNHWAATAERRIDNVISKSKELDIDGLVHFMQWGCQTCNNMAKILGQVAEGHGIKSIYFRGSCQDQRKHNQKEFENELNEWLDLFINNKF